jgi:hypothetical protein
MDLKTAMGQLDPANDGHWTEDGAPNMDVLANMTGAEVTRDKLMEADPHFTRETQAAAEVAGPNPEGDDVQTHQETEAPQEATGNDGAGSDVAGGDDAVLSDSNAPQVTSEVPLVGAVPITQPVLDEEALVELEALGVGLKQAVVEADKAVTEAKAAYDKAVAAHDEWLLKMEGESEPPHIVNQRNIQAAIAASTKQRAEKAERQQNIIAALGGDATTKSPLDAVMGRPSGRGSKRPERPLMKSGG